MNSYQLRYLSLTNLISIRLPYTIRDPQISMIDTLELCHLDGRSSLVSLALKTNLFSIYTVLKGNGVHLLSIRFIMSVNNL